MTLAESFVSTRTGKYLVRRFGLKRAQALVNDLRPYISKQERILDVGAGVCDVVDLLQRDGFSVTPIDIKNLSCIDGIQSIVFDGETLPFPDRSFDTVMFVTVLHHIPDPERSLREAKRVAKRVLVYEDICYSTWQKYVTFFMDSLVNFEFFGHPHSNRDDQGWKETFARLGLKVLRTKYKDFTHFGCTFANALYEVVDEESL